MSPRQAPHRASRAGTTRVVRILTAVSIFTGLVSPDAIPALPEETPPPSGQKLSPEETRLRVDWRIGMAQVPLPKKGCCREVDRGETDSRHLIETAWRSASDALLRAA